MEKDFVKGYAFVLEGATEKEFYLCLLNHFCQKYSAKLTRIVNDSTPDIVYELELNKKLYIIKFNVVNTITQVPRAGVWFKTQCQNKYSTVWHVFLCYDQDDYKSDISKFYKDDWAILRNSLSDATSVIDIAAAADIEDVMLVDVDNIYNYLGCIEPIELRGGKGKTKMKNLFRTFGQTYHEGSRAKVIIEKLDMEKIIANSLVPLNQIEDIIFKTN